MTGGGVKGGLRREETTGQIAAKRWKRESGGGKGASESAKSFSEKFADTFVYN